MEERAINHPHVMSHNIVLSKYRRNICLTLLFSSTLLEELPSQSAKSIGTFQKTLGIIPRIAD